MPPDLNREDLVTELRALRAQLERKGVTRVSLFGSRARNDHRPDSDVDLLIDVEEGRKFSLLDLVGVAHAVEDEVHLPVNIFMRRSLDGSFLQTAAIEQVRVY